MTFYLKFKEMIEVKGHFEYHFGVKLMSSQLKLYSKKWIEIQLDFQEHLIKDRNQNWSLRKKNNH